MSQGRAGSPSPPHLLFVPTQTKHQPPLPATTLRLQLRSFQQACRGWIQASSPHTRPPSAANARLVRQTKSAAAPGCFDMDNIEKRHRQTGADGKSTVMCRSASFCVGDGWLQAERVGHQPHRTSRAESWLGARPQTLTCLESALRRPESRRPARHTHVMRMSLRC
jgi:hypothetical protein